MFASFKFYTRRGNCDAARNTIIITLEDHIKYVLQ